MATETAKYSANLTRLIESRDVTVHEVTGIRNDEPSRDVLIDTGFTVFGTPEIIPCRDSKHGGGAQLLFLFLEGLSLIDEELDKLRTMHGEYVRFAHPLTIARFAELSSGVKKRVTYFTLWNIHGGKFGQAKFWQKKVDVGVSNGHWEGENLYIAFEVNWKL